MKINLVKIKFDGRSSYKYRPFDYCCRKLNKNENIILANDDFVDYEPGYEDAEGDTIPHFCITSTDTITSYDDEWTETLNYPISFCPHCGEKIEINVTDEIDLSEDYEETERKRHEIWNKAEKTDSKKKENELRREGLKLDEKLNWYMALAAIADDEEEEEE